MRKATKTIISLAVILIAGLNFIVPAFAQDPFSAIAIGGIGGASGAGLFGSMASASGIEIGWGNNTANQMDAMWNVLNPDHVYFSGEKHEANPQEYPEDIYDYIKVDIGDWLDAQSDFIIKFAQDNNVSDNDSGNITSTYNSYAGYVFNDFYPGTQTPRGASIGVIGDGIFQVGEYKCVLTGVESNTYHYTTYFNNQQVGSPSNVSTSNQGVPVYLRLFGGSIDARGWGTGYVFVGNSARVTLDNPYNVNWSSGTVNTSVFDGWTSAKVKIPHSISGLSTGWTVPEFMNVLDQIWYGHGEDNIIIENGGDDPPVPPVPVPTTPLGEVPFDDWVDLWGQGIYEQLENQSDALDFIGSNGEDAVEELESIDSNLGDIKEDTGSIDTNIGIGNGLLGGIKSAAESAVEYLEGIAEHVEELVEEIVEGTETLIAGILNQIPSVFGVIFGPIKQASSIWHYVVEWIQSISAPMTWMWNIAGTTSYNIQLPIYASLAGAVVLAFYKRFGK